MIQKEISIDELAGMVQKGFIEVKSEIKEFKTDVSGLKTDVYELKTDVAEVKHRVEAVDLHLSAYASRWNEEFERLHNWVKEIDGRLGAVESKFRK